LAFKIKTLRIKVNELNKSFIPIQNPPHPPLAKGEKGGF
jgi:hypothetical protein